MTLFQDYGGEDYIVNIIGEKGIINIIILFYKIKFNKVFSINNPIKTLSLLNKAPNNVFIRYT